MTKQSIVSILKNISDNCRTDTTATETMFRINDTEKLFAIRIADGKKIYCGTIYCDCIIIIDDDREFIDFINDGKIIAILDYSVIEKIDLL